MAILTTLLLLILSACGGRDGNGNGSGVVVQPTAHSVPTAEIINSGALSEDDKTPTAQSVDAQEPALGPTPLPVAPRQ